MICNKILAATESSDCIHSGKTEYRMGNVQSTGQSNHKAQYNWLRIKWPAEPAA